MTKLRQLRPLLSIGSKQQYNSFRFASKKEGGDGKDKKPEKKEAKKDCGNKEGDKAAKTPMRIEDIEEPTNCCMSGCANCVWVQYAEKVAALMKDSDHDVQKLIMEKVQDPNMRAFLAMELRLRKLVK